MHEQLKQILTYVSSFSNNELDEITGCFRPRSVKRNTILLSEGAVCREFYVVCKGCIRLYYLAQNGEEKTRYIMPDNYIGTALTSFISQKPSFEVIDAPEDTELLYISHTDFYRLNNDMANWKVFYQKILEMAYTYQTRRIESMVTLSAAQRYQQLLQEDPALVQRLSNKVLASFLDIRQETLSRIKSK